MRLASMTVLRGGDGGAGGGVTGPLIEWSGLPAAGVTAVLIALVPLLMLAASR